jgi:CO/xanthine dehydrogenase Mo-binding subunit
MNTRDQAGLVRALKPLIDGARMGAGPTNPVMVLEMATDSIAAELGLNEVEFRDAVGFDTEPTNPPMAAVVQINQRRHFYE